VLQPGEYVKERYTIIGDGVGKAGSRLANGLGRDSGNLEFLEGSRLVRQTVRLAEEIFNAR
jgi:hypothetical protein